MSQIPDPQQPWRPLELGGPDILPMGDGIRPEKPAPLPAPEAPRPRPRPANKKPSRKELWKVDDPAAAAEEARQLMAREQLLGAAVVTLLFAGGALAFHLGLSHITRILAALVPLLVAMFLILRLLAKRPLWNRLRILGLAVVLAALCWLFVPTTNGNSLATLLRSFHDLSRLDPSDHEQFLKMRATRVSLLEDFPSWKETFDHLDQTWSTAWVNSRLAEIEDDNGTRLEMLQKYQNLRVRANQVGAPPFAMDLVVKKQKEAFLGYFDGEITRIRALLVEGKFAQVYERVAELIEERRMEAMALGQIERFDAGLKEIRVEAIKKHTGLARTQLDRLLREGKHVEVAQEGQAFVRDIGQAAIPEQMTDYVTGALTEPRRTALTLRVERSCKEIETRIANQDWAGIEVFSQKQLANLQEEATLLGRRSEVAEALAAPRKKAVLARLNHARQEARELLRQDRYQALGSLGDTVHKELASESKQVNLDAEVGRFRDSCRVFADLARKAKIEDRK